MTKVPKIAFGLLLLLGMLSEPVHAQSEGVPKFAFVRELQKAVRADDRSWLAGHIDYPLRHHGRVVTIIRNRADFVRNYATIVSDKLRAAILAQEPDKVFENWQGVMVGSGTHNIWLRESSQDNDQDHDLRYEIVTINDMP